MARHEITMPQLGETVTEGTITKWLKQVGDEIKPDDLLFEVSTDKVDSEVPAPNAGFLVEILVPEGDTVAVGTPIAVVGDEPGGAGAAAAPAPAAAPEPEPEPEPAAEAAPAVAPEPSAPEAAAPAPAAPAAAEGVVLSPVVRRLMAEYDVDPSAVHGTGAGGRITRNDVLAHIEGKGGSAPTTAPAAAAAAAAASAPVPTPMAEAPKAPAPAPVIHRGEGDEIVPMSNIRKRTAEHMLRSKATSPHVMMSVEVDFQNVERTRIAAKDTWKAEEGFSLTYLPFIARAVCDAIAEFPHVNASIDGDDLIVHNFVNLGIAVDLDFHGLVVPVVRGADSLRLRHLARTIRDLAERARSKQLGPDDIQGGTYTITNPGPFATFISAPIINQPQVAILSTEGIKKRPVVIDTPNGDAIVIHHTGVLSQSFDHRAFDGAYSASFLGRVREILETRDWEPELG